MRARTYSFCAAALVLVMAGFSSNTAGSTAASAMPGARFGFEPSVLRAEQVFQHPLITFRMPDTWAQLQSADGHDASRTEITDRATGDRVGLVWVLATRPREDLLPYSSSSRRTVDVGGRSVTILSGTVVRQLLLDEYLGATSEVPLGSRPPFSVMAAKDGEREFRAIMDTDRNRFEIVLIETEQVDENVLLNILSTVDLTPASPPSASSPPAEASATPVVTQAGVVPPTTGDGGLLVAFRREAE